MTAVTQQLMSQRQCVSQDCRAARAMLQAATSRLQLELGSAGNIWLEEGQAGDAWVQSCRELLRNNSNLTAGVRDGKQQQAGDIQVCCLLERSIVSGATSTACGVGSCSRHPVVLSSFAHIPRPVSNGCPVPPGSHGRACASLNILCVQASHTVI
jgi:hypothetical protein